MAGRREDVQAPKRRAVRMALPEGDSPGDSGTVGVPRGLEVLVRKAAVDTEFRKLLLEERAAAAGDIGLALEPAEAAMLAAIPAAQLEAIIASTRVGPKQRAAFLGRAAAVMIAALGAAPGCPRRPQAIRAMRSVLIIPREGTYLREIRSEPGRAVSPDDEAAPPGRDGAIP